MSSVHGQFERQDNIIDDYNRSFGAIQDDFNYGAIIGLYAETRYSDKSRRCRRPQKRRRSSRGAHHEQNQGVTGKDGLGTWHDFVNA
jgi:hypothetical protein